MKKYINIVYWGREACLGNSEEFDTLTEAREYARDYGGKPARVYLDDGLGWAWQRDFWPAKEPRTYAERKEAATREAIEWQLDFGHHNYGYSELADFRAHFEKLGRRFGLLREFRENGII